MDLSKNVIMDVETQLPLGFPMGGYPGPQGLYYCSVGGKNTPEDTLLKNTDLCLDAGINFEDQPRGCLRTVGVQLFAKGLKSR